MRIRASCAVLILVIASTACTTTGPAGDTTEPTGQSGPVACKDAIPQFEFGSNTIPMDSQPHPYTCLQYKLGGDWYLQVIKGAHGAKCVGEVGCDKHGVRMCAANAGGPVEGATPPCTVVQGESPTTGPNGCKICASPRDTPHALAEDPEL